ncbi:hypothetical protein DFH09DRAFT_1090387 [Mycena vulgaris]|nr:hypothetical protein DFH09DRAFT_1090387 [Mycena vulgaris]
MDEWDADSGQTPAAPRRIIPEKIPMKCQQNDTNIKRDRGELTYTLSVTVSLCTIPCRGPCTSRLEQKRDADEREIAPAAGLQPRHTTRWGRVPEEVVSGAHNRRKGKGRTARARLSDGERTADGVHRGCCSRMSGSGAEEKMGQRRCGRRSTYTLDENVLRAGRRAGEGNTWVGGGGGRVTEPGTLTVKPGARRGQTTRVGRMRERGVSGDQERLLRTMAWRISHLEAGAGNSRCAHTRDSDGDASRSVLRAALEQYWVKGTPSKRLQEVWADHEAGRG